LRTPALERYLAAAGQAPTDRTVDRDQMRTSSTLAPEAGAGCGYQVGLNSVGDGTKMSTACEQPVRPATTHESRLLADARRAGPFVAWRDAAETLRVEALRADQPLIAGRSSANAVVFDRGLVSRDHVEVLLRVRGELGDASVYVLDLQSKLGTLHRSVVLERGVERSPGRPEPLPVQPSRPLQLGPGDHDIGLAGAVWLLIGGVPVDRGMTRVPDHGLPAPTKREHDVLVELCRPKFRRGTGVATPSNSEIGGRLQPQIGAARVSDLLSAMYAKYGLVGTKEQNRISLAELALQHGLVRPDDYI
jgi:hypothetical protein